MSSGTVLNNLLGLTSANPASAKASNAKNRAESNERFQQAFEQVRPDIAARKPAIQTANPADSSNRARPGAKPASENASQSSAAQSKTIASKVTDSKADRPSGQSEVTQQKKEAGTDTARSEESAEKLPPNDQQAAVQNQIDLERPPILTTGEQELVEGGLATQTEVDGILLKDSELVELDASEVSVILDPSLTSLQSTTSSMVGGAGVKGEHLLGGNPAGTSALEANLLAGQAVGGVINQQLSSEGGATLEGDADFLAVSDPSKNPDFLMLNSKSSLNKLAEAIITATDSEKAAIDLSKPLASTATEALARLAEAQSPATRGFVVQTGVPVALGSPQWSQAVGDKVLWLAAQNVSAAEIRLDPPELGPMQVKVTVNQDQQASVTFTSPHPAVREALDQQLNRLREMFSEQGLNLVNVDVSDKSFTQREQEESAKRQAGNAEVDEEELMPVAVSQSISSRLVDHYA